MAPNWTAVLDGCLRRIGTWHVPPKFAPSDWREEIRAQGAAAACQALHDFDPTRGIPLPFFLHQRVIASALTRYRQEWTFACHCVCPAYDQGYDRRPQNASACLAAPEWLRDALSCLTDAELGLIHLLFWDGWTEAEVADALGISQQAVSKRKRAALATLRAWVEASEKKA